MTEPMDFRGLRADDTPRDPLAALLHEVVHEVEAVGCRVGHAEFFRPHATALLAHGVTLDAARPSGDEALRAVNKALDYLAPPHGEGTIAAAIATLTSLRVALATPSSAPDVEGLLDGLLAGHYETVGQVIRAIADARAALRDSRP